MTLTVDKFGGDTVLDRHEIMFKQFEGGSNKWEYIGPVDLLAHVNSRIDIKTDSHQNSGAKDGKTNSGHLLKQLKQAQGKAVLQASALHGSWNVIGGASERLKQWLSAHKM